MDSEPHGGPPSKDSDTRPIAPAQSRLALRVLWGAVALTALAATLLFFEVPTVQRLTFWFWPLRDKQLLGVVLVALAGAGLPYLVWLTCRRASASTHRLTALLLLLIGWGFVLQHALSHAERRSLDGMRARVVLSGHGEFARMASGELTAWQVLSRYEELVQRKGSNFSRSKPPGQLLVYLGLARLGDTLLPHLKAPSVRGVKNDTHWRLATLAAFVLPLCSCLVLLPLLGLARQWLPPHSAAVALLLMMLAPPLVLVTAHLDQALYPLLGTSLLWSATAAGRAATPRAMLGRGVLLGALTWCSLLVSFTLLPVLLIAAGLWLGLAVSSSAAQRRQMLKTAAVSVGAFASLAVLFRLAAGYDLLARFFAVMEQHQAWRRWDAGAGAWTTWQWTPGNMLSSAASTLTELCYWLGPPLVLLVLLGLARSLVLLRRRQAAPLDWFTLAWMAAILATALLGSTRAEVARLWIFFIPGLCIIAAGVAAPWFRQARPWPAHLLALTQLLWVLMLKAFQDF